MTKRYLASSVGERAWRYWVPPDFEAPNRHHESAQQQIMVMCGYCEELSVADMVRNFSAPFPAGCADNKRTRDSRNTFNYAIEHIDTLVQQLVDCGHLNVSVDDDDDDDKH